MKPVIKFEANDERHFNTPEQALNHDTILQFEQWYEKNKLYGNVGGSRVDWDDLFEWLEDNSEMIMKILLHIKKQNK